MTSSDYDITAYNSGTGGVVAYAAGSQVTKQCAVEGATDHVTDCIQLATSSKRRLAPAEVTSSTQAFESRTSGYLLPNNTMNGCKRQRSVEFSGTASNYGHSFTAMHQTS